VPVIAASGGESGRLGPAVAQVAAEVPGHIVTVEGADFGEIAKLARESRPDLLLATARAIDWPANSRCRSCASASRSTTGSAASAFCISVTAAPSGLRRSRQRLDRS